jgi:hypothetical protein
MVELYLYPLSRPVQACNGTALPFTLHKGDHDDDDDNNNLLCNYKCVAENLKKKFSVPTVTNS